MAGIKSIPLSFGAALVTIITGFVISKTGDYRKVFWLGVVVMTVGFGLLTMLDNDTSL